MGCSNEHPHGQIWASSFLPNEVHKKNENQLKYFEVHKSRLLNDYLAKELSTNERVILQNECWVVLVSRVMIFNLIKFNLSMLIFS